MEGNPQQWKFLFPVKASSSVFRARYVAALRKAFPNESKSFFESLFKTNWVVYAKRPFGGPPQVIEYLGRYIHKIAISNYRLINVDDSVSFSYKDYRDIGTKKQMTLKATEFIRRFALHILPKGFVRIRHYGILSSTVKGTALPAMRQQLEHQLPIQEKNVNVPATTPVEQKCPCCKKGVMRSIMDFDFRGPPSMQFLKEFLKNSFASSNPEKNAI